MKFEQYHAAMQQVVSGLATAKLTVREGLQVLAGAGLALAARAAGDDQATALAVLDELASLVAAARHTCVARWAESATAKGGVQ